MDDQSLARQASGLVLAGWSRPVASATPLGGGMNSATALVDLVDERAVLKWVRDPAALAAGCDAAQRLARHGLLTGEPFPTTAGNLIHPADNGAVALLRFVPGEVLSPDDPQDQRDMALTLAAVHATEATSRSGTFASDQIAEMVHDVESWIRPSVDLVLEEYGSLPALTWSLLHADPEAGAFLRQPDTGEVALIDWTSTMYGPVLYDVASALMYLGGRHEADAFWDAYVRHSPASTSELTQHLGTFTRYRAAVQAAYFSMRIGTQDRTGIDDDGENWKGLRDAERMLRANGAHIVTPPSSTDGVSQIPRGDMEQGAVGHVRQTQWQGRALVEKRFTDRSRQDVEVMALRALADGDLPVPELVDVRSESILMTLMSGDRLDSSSSDVRLQRLHASGTWLRRLHQRPVPAGLPPAPDDASIIARYQDAGGPPLPLAVPSASPAVFCHGDWTDGNLLAVGTVITAIIDWEAAHLGDPLRELSRAAWGASLKDVRSVDALVSGYGADPAAVRAWFPIHAAELWLWFAEAGPPEYLEQLTARLMRWPDG